MENPQPWAPRGHVPLGLQGLEARLQEMAGRLREADEAFDSVGSICMFEQWSCSGNRGPQLLALGGIAAQWQWAD